MLSLTCYLFEQYNGNNNYVNITPPITSYKASPTSHPKCRSTTMRKLTNHLKD